MHGFATAVDYLITEVLSNQPPEMPRLMAATSILDQFSAPLCDALNELDGAPGPDDISGGEFIARLRQENLFLITLDTEIRWFRYHHMFRQLLQKQLNRLWRSEEIAEKLFTSTATVKGHLQNIYGKLNVSKRREAG